MFKKWTKKLIILALTVQNLSFDKNCRLDFRCVFNEKMVFWAVKTLLGLAFDRFLFILLKTVKKMEKSDPFGVFWGKSS